jgi:hypothetical protein
VHFKHNSIVFVAGSSEASLSEKGRRFSTHTRERKKGLTERKKEKKILSLRKTPIDDPGAVGEPVGRGRGALMPCGELGPGFLLERRGRDGERGSMTGIWRSDAVVQLGEF